MGRRFTKFYGQLHYIYPQATLSDILTLGVLDYRFSNQVSEEKKPILIKIDDIISTLGDTIARRTIVNSLDFLEEIGFISKKVNGSKRFGLEISICDEAYLVLDMLDEHRTSSSDEKEIKALRKKAKKIMRRKPNYSKTEDITTNIISDEEIKPKGIVKLKQKKTILAEELINYYADKLKQLGGVYLSDKNDVKNMSKLITTLKASGHDTKIKEYIDAYLESSEAKKTVYAFVNWGCSNVINKKVGKKEDARGGVLDVDAIWANKKPNMKSRPEEDDDE